LQKHLDIATGAAVRYRDCTPIVPLRRVLACDQVGRLKPQAFLWTDQQAGAMNILDWFAERWQIKVKPQGGTWLSANPNPAPMVSSGHCPIHARRCRYVFLGHLTVRLVAGIVDRPAAPGGLVSQGLGNLLQ